MKKKLFRILARINKILLPSYSRRRLDLSRAGKLEKAVLAWRSWVTRNAL